MNAVVYSVDVYLKTVDVPEKYEPILVLPDGKKMSKGDISYGVIALSAVPALLTVILLFIESEVTLLECFKVCYRFIGIIFIAWLMEWGLYRENNYLGKNARSVNI